MPKLNQLIAIINGTKKKSGALLSELYKKIQKPNLFVGSNRFYTPVQEDGYVYPSESQKVTFIAKDCLDEYVEATQEFFDQAFAQDLANTKAVASIKVDDQVILKDVPVTHLLFLEKQLTDVRTFISKLPVLPVDKDWSYDQIKRFYVTPEKQTTKTKKITDFVVVVEPTKEHRAEVRDRTVDINEGTWSLVEYSGALPEEEIKNLLKKVDALLKAVVFAREEANGLDVKVSNTSSKAIFEYLFG